MYIYIYLFGMFCLGIIIGIMVHNYNKRKLPSIKYLMDEGFISITVFTNIDAFAIWKCYIDPTIADKVMISYDGQFSVSYINDLRTKTIIPKHYVKFEDFD